MASWLVCLTPERMVRVRSWPGTLCCVLGQDTLLPRCLSPPRCINEYRQNAGSNPAMDWHPIQGGVEILLVASCHGNRDKLRPDGPLGSYADSTFDMRISNFFYFWPLSEYHLSLHALHVPPYEKKVVTEFPNLASVTHLVFAVFLCVFSSGTLLK